MHDITYTRALRGIVAARATFAVARAGERTTTSGDRIRKDKKCTSQNGLRHKSYHARIKRACDTHTLQNGRRNCGPVDTRTRLDARATWTTRETNARWCVGLCRDWCGNHVLRDSEDGRRRGGAALDVCFECVPVPVFLNGGDGVEIFAGLASVVEHHSAVLFANHALVEYEFQARGA